VESDIYVAGCYSEPTEFCERWNGTKTERMLSVGYALTYFKFLLFCWVWGGMRRQGEAGIVSVGRPDERETWEGGFQVVGGIFNQSASSLQISRNNEIYSVCTPY